MSDWARRPEEVRYLNNAACHCSRRGMIRIRRMSTLLAPRARVAYVGTMIIELERELSWTEYNGITDLNQYMKGIRQE